MEDCIQRAGTMSGKKIYFKKKEVGYFDMGSTELRDEAKRR